MLANPRPLVATIYNPHTQSKEALIAGFIARKAKFERLFRDIREAPMTAPEQHYLIQGVRGMGKTTLLLRLAYEIENTPDLHAKLIPIVFNEEEYGISSLADLWERTAQYLEEADPLFAGLEKMVGAQDGQDDYERRAIDTILGALKQHGKKLLLLIDNIGDLLKKLDDQEGKRLREVLLTTADIRLVGGTPTTIDQTHDYARPFFEFFKVVHLEGLNKTEAIDLFLKLGEAFHADAVKQIVEHQPGRIEAIRRLTGGVIRTMVLLFEIMVEENSGSVFKDLNVLLDRVTPLYKHRMDDLPTQQQKIVAALAQAWDAANTKELAQVVRLESKVVSAQLKQLINNGVVEKVETNTKNHLYRLEERFFNIWYLMRFSRRTDQRVLWLVKFFEGMFDGDEEWLQERVEGHLRAMDAGTIEEEAALYLTSAYRVVVRGAIIEDSLIKKTRTYLIKRGKKDLERHLLSSQYESIDKQIFNKQYAAALDLLNKISSRYSDVYADKAACQLLLGDKAQAEKEIVKGYASFITDEKLREDLLKSVENEWVDSKGYLTLTGVKNYVKSERAIGSMLTLYIDILTVDGTHRVQYHLSSTDETSLVEEILMVYFLSVNPDRKQFAEYILETFYKHDFNHLHIKAIAELIWLWNNEFEKVRKNSLILSKESQAIEWRDHWVDWGTQYTQFNFLLEHLLKLLLAKKQYHTAYNYFQQEEWQLKDRFKPLYYSTLHFLQDEHPTDYLRMGPELRETVDDVLAEVAQMAIDYA